MIPSEQVRPIDDEYRKRLCEELQKCKPEEIAEVLNRMERQHKQRVQHLFSPNDRIS